MLSLVQNNNKMIESVVWPILPLLSATIVTDRLATVPLLIDRIHRVSLVGKQIQCVTSQWTTLVTNVLGVRCHYCH